MRRAGYVRTRLAPVSICALALVLFAGGTSSAILIPNPFDNDVLDRYGLDCEEFVPLAISADGATDDGRFVTLDVLVLLDGISKTRGRDVMATAARSYKPLGIELRSTFRRVKLQDAEVTSLLDDSREAVGGSRPKGFDVVYTMTSKDLYLGADGSGDGLGGYAQCIGGVRRPDIAFAIGEGQTPWEADAADDELSGKFAAHEIGHLMGAHHHYGNCVEGDGRTEGGGEPSICTLMWGAVINLMASNFGTLEGLVIRGHAIEFAAP